MSDDATVREALVEVVRDAFDEWLYRMHGLTSSCRHEIEAEEITTAALRALDLPARDARVRAETLAPFEALAEKWGGQIARANERAAIVIGLHLDDLGRALASAGPVEPSPACPATICSCDMGALPPCPHRSVESSPAAEEARLPIHRTEANYGIRCSTCDGGGCLDCTDPA